jgi:hypothetical protein
MEAVSQLLAKGASVESKDDEGYTALHLAALNDRPKIISLLVDHNADINARDNRQRTALHLATIQGNTNAAKALLDHHPTVDLRNDLGRTPLMEAALFGRLEIVQSLLKSGADRNLKTEGSLTAYDFARDDVSWTAEERENYIPNYMESYLTAVQRRAIMNLVSQNANSTRRGRCSLVLHKSLETMQTEIVEELQFDITDSDKTVAFLDRGPAYPYILAISGHTTRLSPPPSKSTIILPNYMWSRVSLEILNALTASMKLPAPILKAHEYDDGVRGMSEACHAEKQLIAFYLYEHYIRAWDLTATEDTGKASPADSDHPPQCKIKVNNPPFLSCRRLKKLIEEYFDIDITIDARPNGRK